MHFSVSKTYLPYCFKVASLSMSIEAQVLLNRQFVDFPKVRKSLTRSFHWTWKAYLVSLKVSKLYTRVKPLLPMDDLSTIKVWVSVGDHWPLIP